MSEKIKIAVIGTGWWATQAHIPALLANPHADVILIDRNAEKLNHAARSFAIAHAYADLPSALAAHPDLRGAVVAVSHKAHYPVAREVLEHGLHLLLEKPMVLLARDAKALVELAQQKRLHILMGYVYPYLDAIRAARQFVDDGLLGNIEYVTCAMSSMTIEFLRGRPQSYQSVFNYPVTGPTESTYSSPETAGGGQGHLQISHLASLMFHLAGSLRPKTVSAFMDNLDCAVDVVDAFVVRMENGALVTVGSTGNLGQGDGGIVEVHLHGSKGRLLVEAISGHIYLRLHDGSEQRIEPTFPGYPSEAPTQHFIDIIRTGANNLLPGATVGLYTVELLDAAYRSAAQEGQPVPVSSLYA